MTRVRLVISWALVPVALVLVAACEREAAVNQAPPATSASAGASEERSTSAKARLVALSKAQDVLTGERWAGADLGDIVRAALDPYTTPGSTRFQTGGVPVRVSPRSALILAMAIHELCTNAGKYGALSAPQGRVRVSWQVESSGTTEKELQLRWEESGGPAVTPPSRKGFGSRLIESALAAELGGEVRLAFNPAGVVCDIRAPLEQVQAEDFPSPAPGE